MLLLKACPHCRRGDLIVEREQYGAVVTCLQCGYTGDLRSLRQPFPAPTVARSVPEREKVPA